MKRAYRKIRTDRLNNCKNGKYPKLDGCWWSSGSMAKLFMSVFYAWWQLKLWFAVGGSG